MHTMLRAYQLKVSIGSFDNGSLLTNATFLTDLFSDEKT